MKNIKILMFLIFGCLSVLALSPILGFTLNEQILPEHDIIFPHRLHLEEAELECDICHGEIGSSAFAKDNNLPAMDNCEDCHDIEDEDNCGLCHKNAEDPEGFNINKRLLVFNHARHLEQSVACRTCHLDIFTKEASDAGVMPPMILCMSCHDGVRASRDCRLCHENRIGLIDIHPPGWRSIHGETAVIDADYCQTCHDFDNDCLACHLGDNLTGRIHELNYIFTHSLDAKGGRPKCTTCHEHESFCVECHRTENRIPLLHSSLSWLTEHGRAARNDIENCAACHESDRAICALGGCHADSDGLRGTDPAFHDITSGRFDAKGNWHEDNSSLCYQCHTYTGQAGLGFCGYCHGAEDD